MAHMFSNVRNGVRSARIFRGRVGWDTAERRLVGDEGVSRHRPGGTSRLFTVVSEWVKELLALFIAAGLFGRDMCVMEVDRGVERNAVIMMNNSVDFVRVARILGG